MDGGARATEHAIAVPQAPVARVSALHLRAPVEAATLVFGHGAGADMLHRTMQAIAQAFAAVGISTLRFNFPFKEAKKSRVDAKPVSIATIEAALDFARERFGEPLFLGGHSFGGRMATHAVVERQLDVAGLILASFPLHPAGRLSVDRAAHLDAVKPPLLFLSGTRDALADAQLLSQVVKRVGGTLAWLDDGDHGYKTRKRHRARPDDIFAEMAGHARQFVLKAVGDAPRCPERDGKPHADLRSQP